MYCPLHVDMHGCLFTEIAIKFRSTHISYVVFLCNIVWDNEKVIDFQTSLMNKNGYIQQFMYDVSTEPIDDVVNTFSYFLHDQAFDTFGKAYSQKKSTHHHEYNE